MGVLYQGVGYQSPLRVDNRTFAETRMSPERTITILFADARMSTERANTARKVLVIGLGNQAVTSRFDEFKCVTDLDLTVCFSDLCEELN